MTVALLVVMLLNILHSEYGHIYVSDDNTDSTYLLHLEIGAWQYLGMWMKLGFIYSMGSLIYIHCTL